MPPGTVAIERRGIVLNRLGQVLSGSPVPFRSPGLRPPVESIPGGRVVDVGVGRRCSGARKRAFSGAQRGLPVFIHQVRSAAQNDELDLIGLGIAGRLRVTTVAGDRNAVFTRLLNLRPPGRRINSVGHASGRSWNGQPHAPFQQPDHFVRLKVDGGIVVEVQRCAVAEENLDAAVLGSESVSGEQRHRGWRRFGPAVPFEGGGAVHHRDVCRWNRGSLLS